jgi:copper chaperone
MIELRVDGMTCGHCAAAVKRAVEKVAPGATATVDLAAGAVRLAGPADEAAVRAAIRAAGYDPV